MHRLFFLAPLVMLGGCMSMTPSDTMISERSNVSVSYRAGFDDGCHSGRQAAGALFEQFRKDQARFTIDRDYAQGWSDAFRQCESREEAQQRRMRSAAVIDSINQSQDDRFDRILAGIDYSGLEGL